MADFGQFDVTWIIFGYDMILYIERDWATLCQIRKYYSLWSSKGLGTLAELGVT